MSTTVNISNSIIIYNTSSDLSSQKAHPVTKMPAFVPTAITAVESQGLSILYYARPDKYLASLTAQRQGEDPSFPPYTAANVILKGNTVQTTVPQVSAVAYKYQGNDEVCCARGREWSPNQ